MELSHLFGFGEKTALTLVALLGQSFPICYGRDKKCFWEFKSNEVTLFFYSGYCTLLEDFCCLKKLPAVR